MEPKLEQDVRAWEQDAREKTSQLRWSRADLERLVVDARAAVGDQPRSHNVRVDPERWPADVATLLQDHVHDGWLSRGAVIDAGACDGRGWPLFILSNVWGRGLSGYGPAKLSLIRTATQDTTIRAILEDALHLDTLGPVAAYHRLRGMVPEWGPPSSPSGCTSPTR